MRSSGLFRSGRKGNIPGWSGVRNPERTALATTWQPEAIQEADCPWPGKPQRNSLRQGQIRLDGAARQLLIRIDQALHRGASVTRKLGHKPFFLWKGEVVWQQLIYVGKSCALSKNRSEQRPRPSPPGPAGSWREAACWKQPAGWRSLPWPSPAWHMPTRPFWPGLPKSFWGPAYCAPTGRWRLVSPRSSSRARAQQLDVFCRRDGCRSAGRPGRHRPGHPHSGQRGAPRPERRGDHRLRRQRAHGRSEPSSIDHAVGDPGGVVRG